MLQLQTKTEHKQLNFTRRIISKSPKDAWPPYPEDQQTRMISRIMEQPVEFKQFIPIQRERIPELFMSSAMLRMQREEALLQKF